MLLGCNPDRIGHGTFLHPKAGGTPEIIDIVSSKKIPIGKQKQEWICLAKRYIIIITCSFNIT